MEGLYAGRHASPLAGARQDFFDYRPYTPGDEPADVDWKLYGRTDRLHIRRYRRPSSLEAYLLVDASASMNFASPAGAGPPPDLPPRGGEKSGLTKARYAATLAAAMAFLAVRQSDRAGLGLFDQALREHLPPAGTLQHLQRLCALLEQTRCRGQADVGAVGAQVQQLLRRRGLVVLISDLLDEPEGLFDALSRLRHSRFDVIVFQLLTPEELHLDLSPRHVHLTDSESPLTVPTDVQEVGPLYRRLIRQHIDIIRAGCVARGADYHLVHTSRHPLQVLRHYLLRRAALR